MRIHRHFATGIIATALSLTSTSADAGRAIPHGWYEDTSFVAETSIPGLSLCHLVKKHHVAYLTYSYESLGYVLAEKSCDADSFWPVDASYIAQMQAEGSIAADLPTTPVFNLRQKIQGSLLYVLVGIGAIFFVMSKIGGATGLGRNRRPTKSKHADTRMLAVMCQVAKCDGKIEPGEIATIASVIKRLTGNNIPVNQIADMIHNTDLYHDLPHLSALGDGLGEHDRLNLLEAALTIAVSDGSIATEEYAFIQELSHALQIRADDFRVSLRRIAGTLAPQMA